MKHSAHDKLRCVIRELGYRRHVYRYRVDNGKMSPHQAQLEISLMEAIAEDYRALARKDELPLGDPVAS